MALLIFYQKLLKDMESQGLELNLYDPCVVNKMVNGKQMTIVYQVDDLNIYKCMRRKCYGLSNGKRSCVTKILWWHRKRIMTAWAWTSMYLFHGKLG